MNKLLQVVHPSPLSLIFLQDVFEILHSLYNPGCRYGLHTRSTALVNDRGFIICPGSWDVNSIPCRR